MAQKKTLQLLQPRSAENHRTLAAADDDDKMDVDNKPLSLLRPGDAGVRRILAETVQQVRRHARPWIDANQQHAWEDPYTIQQVGDLRIRVRAAEAVLDLAADAIEAALAAPDEESVAAASIAVAEVSVPVLVGVGDRSGTRTAARGRALADALPCASLREVVDGDHGVHLSNPSGTAALIEELVVLGAPSREKGG